MGKSERKEDEVVDASIVTRPARMPARRRDVTEVKPQQLMELAIEKGEAGVEMLAKLIDLQERVSREEARKAWHAAMAAFQADCPPIPRTKKGRFGPYAPLGSTLPLVRPVLAQHGLSATWTTQIESPHPYKICKLSHELGHVEQAACPIIIDENAGQTSEGKETLNAMQKYGIADTYAERYSFEAVCGLVSSEAGDTDGGSVVEQPKATPPKRRRAAPSKPAPAATHTTPGSAGTEEPPHTADAAQDPPGDEPATTPTEGQSLVQAVSWTDLTGTNARGPWRKVILKASDGHEYSTFSKSNGIMMEAACPTEDHAGEWLQIEWKNGRYDRDVTKVDVAQGPPE